MRNALKVGLLAVLVVVAACSSDDDSGDSVGAAICDAVSGDDVGEALGREVTDVAAAADGSPRCAYGFPDPSGATMYATITEIPAEDVDVESTASAPGMDVEELDLPNGNHAVRRSSEAVHAVHVFVDDRVFTVNVITDENGNPSASNVDALAEVVAAGLAQ